MLGPPGWPRMWQRGWSEANPRVVSPWGRGCSGGNHGSTTLSGSRGSHGGGGRTAAGTAAVGVAALEPHAGGGEER